MPSPSETAYPRLSFNITKNNLVRIYTPTKKERTWIKQQRMNDDSGFAAIVLLKCFQRLGYFPSAADIPPQIPAHIKSILNIDPELDFYLILDKVPEKTLRSHKAKIRTYCKVDKFSLKQYSVWLHESALSLAHHKENVTDIVNALLEMLVKERIEIPALSTLERIAMSARSQANEAYYDSICSVIPNSAKQELLRLLKVKNDAGETLWYQLKQEPEKPSVRTLKRFTEHTDWLRKLQVEYGDLPQIPELKRLQFIYEARSYDAARISRFKRNKRIALLALLTREQLLCATDDLVSLFVKEIRKLHNRAQDDLRSFQTKSVDEFEKLILLLRDIASTMTSECSQREQYETILKLFDNNPANVTTRCNRLVHYGLNNALQFLSSRYTKPLRKALLDCVSYLDIDHTAHGDQLLACLRTVLFFKDTPMKSIAVSTLIDFTDDERVPLDWVKDSWNNILFLNTRRRIINRQLHRDNFELCVLSEVARRLQSGDLYVGNSTKYDDYRTHLISWEDYRKSIDAFCEVAGVHRQPSLFVQNLKEHFDTTARKADQTIPKDSFVVLDNGRLALKKKDQRQKPSLRIERLTKR